MHVVTRVGSGYETATGATYHLGSVACMDEDVTLKIGIFDLNICQCIVPSRVPLG